VTLFPSDVVCAAESDPLSACVDLTVGAVPDLVLTKSESPTSGAGLVAGDTVDYTVTVVNSGSATATNVLVTDHRADVALGCVWSGGVGTENTLAPAGTVSCTGSYTVTQADVDSGATIANWASVTADGFTPSVAAFPSDVVCAAESDPLSACVDLTVSGSPDLVLSKSQSPTSGAGLVAGETVDYTVSVTNSGSATATNVVVTDHRAGVVLSCSGLLAGSLAPGGTVSCTGSYTVTQADVDSGATIANWASVEADGFTPSVTVFPSDVVCAPESDPLSACVDLTVGGVPDLVLSKSQDPTSGVGLVAGSTVDYTVSVVNNGSATATNVVVTDHRAGVVLSCSGLLAGSLAPGGTVTCTGSYTVTQSDIDSGATIANWASVTADGFVPSVGAFPSDVVCAAESDPLSACVDLTVSGMPDLEITKSQSVSGSPVVAGDRITYDITVVNHGSATATSVVIVDENSAVSDLLCDWAGSSDSGTGVGVLSPGEVLSCSASYVVTQGDVDSGVTVTNWATVSCSAAGCGPTALRPPDEVCNTAEDAADDLASCVDLTVGGSPDLVLSKTQVPTSGAGLVAGDVVDYTVSVTNSGSATATNVVVTDHRAGVVLSCSGLVTGSLAPGGTVDCTGSYTVTQADIDSGATIANWASVVADGFTPSVTVFPSDVVCAPESDPLSACVDLTVGGSPDLVLSKSQSPTSGAGLVAGATVNYTVSVTNSGSATATNVQVTDHRAGVVLSCSGLLAGSLAPGGTVACTGSYAVTQSDVDSGATIANWASVSADGFVPSVTVFPSDVVCAAESDPLSACVDLTVGAVPDLVLTKSQSPTSGVGLVAGDVVDYTVSVVNSGSATATNVVVTDHRAGVVLGCVWSGGVGTENTLAPGGTVECTGSYTVTQADVDSGATIANWASVEADGFTPSVTVFDSDVVCAAESDPLSACVDLTVGGAPDLEITKTVDVAGLSSPVTAGGVIVYGVTVENKGTATATDVVIVDENPAVSALSCVWPGSSDTGPGPGVLAPGESAVCSATYVVTQGDIDSGVTVTNWATVSCSAAGCGPSVPVFPPDVACDVSADAADLLSSCVSTVLDGEPHLDLTKSQSPTSGAGLVAGDVVDYTVTVVNNGSATATNVLVTDHRADVVLACVWSGGVGTENTLAPAGTVSCTGSYTVTQADIGSGATIANWASVTADGFVPSVTVFPSDVVCAAESDPLSACVDLAVGAVPDLVLTKSESPTSGAGLVAGDVVDYTVTVVNSGSATATNVLVTDHRADVPLDCVWSGGVGTEYTVAPGGTVTCTGSYTVTQSDIDAGVTISNWASVAADGFVPSVKTFFACVPESDPLSACVDLTVGGAPDLEITKSQTLPGSPVVAGDRIVYEITVVNHGSATASDVVVVDENPGVTDLSCDWSTATSNGVLAPGESVVCEASYTITQADIDAGAVITNWATVSCNAAGCSPTAPRPPDEECNTVEDAADDLAACVSHKVAGQPVLAITKTQQLPSGTPLAPGNLVGYEITVTNSGTATATDVVVEDLGLATLGACVWDGVPDRLAPGESVVCEASYAITQADIDNNAIIANWATVSCSAPGCQPIVTNPPPDKECDTNIDNLDSLSSCVYAVLSSEPNLVLTKVADQTIINPAEPGDVIGYTIEVTNHGVVTASLVDVADIINLENAVCVWPTMVEHLGPGETVTCTGTYTITAADISLGEVVNWATVCSGLGCGQPPIPDPLVCAGETSVTGCTVTELVPTVPVIPPPPTPNVSTGPDAPTGGQVLSPHSGSWATPIALGLLGIGVLLWRRRT
jgi:uncharacterized repeat protein (TIGR01451 family)